MKKFLNTLVLALFALSSIAQVSSTALGGGKYQFDSEYPNEDLHFYLFGDGHHSFENSPFHHFGDDMSPAEVHMFHSEPYTDDEPIDNFITNVFDGVMDPSVPVYQLDNKVSLKRSWNFVNDQNDYIILSFENQEQTTINNGCIEFHYVTTDTPVDALEILDDFNNDWVVFDQNASNTSDYPEYTNKYRWTFTNLKPGEQRHIYIPAKCLAPSMAKLKHMAIMHCGEPLTINPNLDGSNPFINNSPYYTLNSVVSNNPHDPNCIIQDPDCLNLNLTYQPVNYRVYFQNEGEDAATNVFLYYDLRAPFVNLEIVDSSDPCFFQYGNPGTDPSTVSNNRFDIVFQNINLPGLNQPIAPDYEKTIGWVEFNVCYDFTLFDPHMTCVDSSVDIVFDSEAPVTAKNTICKDSPCRYTPTIPDLQLCFEQFQEYQNLGNNGLGNISIEAPGLESHSNEEYSFYPNPVNDIMQLEGNLDKLNSIYIINTQGQILLSKRQGEINKEIDLSFIPSGMYYITIASENESIVKRFVKI